MVVRACRRARPDAGLTFLADRLAQEQAELPGPIAGQ